MSEGKEKEVLILGGAGFIGRNLVKYLIDNKLAKFIRVADKSLPVTSYLNKEHAEAFNNKEIVEFKQADLTKEAHVDRVFAEHKFDYVVNLCGETRFGCSETDYKIKCQDTAEKCVAAAVKNGVAKWVEVSTAQVYEPDKKPSNESGKLKPWTQVANYRLKAEDLVKKAGLEYVILRPAIVYGPGDLTGLSPRIMCAAVYASLKEKMKFLWDKDLKLNAVHVDDVVAAIWTSLTTVPSGSTFNLADQSNLSQGDFNGMLAQIFGIEVGFLGSMVSNLAKLQLSAVATDANDKHVPGWAKLCEEKKITNTPLSPYIDKELLYNNSLCIDGTAITKEPVNFKYTHPQVTKELLLAQIKSFEEQGIFPEGWTK